MSDRDKAMVILGRLCEIHESAGSIQIETILEKATSEELDFFYHKLRK